MTPTIRYFYQAIPFELYESTDSLLSNISRYNTLNILTMPLSQQAYPEHICILPDMSNNSKYHLLLFYDSSFYTMNDITRYIYHHRQPFYNCQSSKQDDSNKKYNYYHHLNSPKDLLPILTYHTI